MSHKGKTQITFIFTARPDQVEEGDRLSQATRTSWRRPITAMVSWRCCATTL